MMKTNQLGKGKTGLLLCLIGLLYFAAPMARAGQSEPGDTSDAGDPPTRVARISYLDGSVSIQPGGTGDWGAAVLNRPMTIGDKLWTDKDSRAELQTGVVSMHLGSMTALSFLNLDQAITQMRIAEGSINFRVKEMREGDVYEVDTPNVVFNVTQAGAFRLDVDENGDSTGITVIRGAGQVIASGKTYDINEGQRGVFNGTEDVQSTVAEAPPPDSLDQWANDRDLREQDSVSAQYVSPDMPGTADLDNNGTWDEQPDVGPVWYPNDVPVDWAPYSYGYWSYIGPWGWTWVDYEPWGFAPFHYGRWGFYGGRWGWCPGPRLDVAIYGPAFVGFLGGGFGFGVGWFPLGFGEPFHPWFHCGPRFIERVNIHNTFIRDREIFRNGSFRNFRYAYAHDARAVTATSRSGFTGGEIVHRGAFHYTDASLRNAHVTNRVGFSPSRQSAFGAAHTRGNIARPPMSVQNRSVMARTAPARGASDMRVHRMDPRGLTAGRLGNSSPNALSNRPANNSESFGRQNEISRNRPSTVSRGNARGLNGTPDRPSSQRVSSGARTWEAQGNATDRGRAPQGFGRYNDASSNAGASQRMNRQDRPPWAGAGASPRDEGSRAPSNSNRGSYSGGNRSYDSPERSAPYQNRGYTPPARTYSAPSRGYPAPGRSYAPPSRSYSPPTRSYSAPGRNYAPPPSRSYSAPSRSYSAPSRSYSAPSRSYSAPSRSYSAPSRSYSAPSRSYSAPSRSYSAPSRSYSAPSRSYSAPSRSYSGGSGGGGSHGGGGSSHGGGGGRGGRPHS